MPSSPRPLLYDIVDSLRRRFGFSNVHYEAAWTDSWCHRRCFHEHSTVRDAAECAMPYGAGWYVFAVENGEPRQLHDSEEILVNKFRFGPDWTDPEDRHP